MKSRFCKPPDLLEMPGREAGGGDAEDDAEGKVGEARLVLGVREGLLVAEEVLVLALRLLKKPSQ